MHALKKHIGRMPCASNFTQAVRCISLPVVYSGFSSGVFTEWLLMCSLIRHKVVTSTWCALFVTSRYDFLFSFLNQLYLQSLMTQHV